MTKKNQDPLPGRPEKMNYMLNDREFHKAIGNADLIFCVDENSGRRSIEFGRGLLKQITNLPEGESRSTCIAVVSLRVETEEYEALLAVLLKFKGYYDAANPRRTKVDVADHSCPN